MQEHCRHGDRFHNVAERVVESSAAADHRRHSSLHLQALQNVFDLVARFHRHAEHFDPRSRLQQLGVIGAVPRSVQGTRQRRRVCSDPAADARPQPQPDHDAGQVDFRAFAALKVADVVEQRNSGSRPIDAGCFGVSEEFGGL